MPAKKHKNAIFGFKKRIPRSIRKSFCYFVLILNAIAIPSKTELHQLSVWPSECLLHPVGFRCKLDWGSCCWNLMQLNLI